MSNPAAESRWPSSPDFTPADRASCAPDSLIVRRIAAGDASALGVLFDRWSDTVHALASLILRRSGAADVTVDAVVEGVFWQVWQLAPYHKSAPGGVASWLVELTRRCAVDALRAPRRTHSTAHTNDPRGVSRPNAGDAPPARRSERG